MSQLLTREQEDMMCKYSSYIVCAAAVIVGLKAFDKDIIAEMIGNKRPCPKCESNGKCESCGTLNHGEKMAYGLLFAAGVACVYCHYSKKY